MDDSAVVSQCGAYRWHLTRLVDNNIFQGGRLLFVMLNPSTADAETDDPTLRRCIGYSRAWGYGGLAVVNLFGLRTTDPRELRRHADPVGRRNDDYVLAAIRSVDVFPARAGMNRPPAPAAGGAGGVPRASGDEPRIVRLRPGRG